ncbi:MAG: tetratricopeptide repeat protein [Polyangiales bacterium]
MRRLSIFALALIPLFVASPSAAEKAGIAKPQPTATATGTGSAAKPKPKGFVATGKLATGLEALEKAEYASAKTAFDGVTGKDQARATIGLARIAYDTGKYGDAESLAKKAMGQAGSDIAVKGDAAGWAAQALLATGKLDDAIKVADPFRDEAKAPRPRAALVEAYVRKGELDEANNVASALEADSETDDPLWEEPGNLACVARAAFLNRDGKYANQTLIAAKKLSKGNVEVNAVRARLGLEWYAADVSDGSIKDGLAVAPDHPMLHLLRAEWHLYETFSWDAAEKEIDAALKINPKLVRAFYVRASMKLHDGDVKGTEEEVAKGLAIDPNALDLLSLRAAARFLDDDPSGFQKAKKVVLDKNPKYGRLYVILAEFLDWEHRYDDLVTLMDEGTKVDPKDGKVWTALGLNLLRRGDEKEGLAALDTAYKYDRYNARLVNTLNLFEKTLAKQYELVDGTGGAKVFRFRFNKDETDVLGKYVPQTLADAWGKMAKKYGFTPKNPVNIEVFTERKDFAIRTDGLPRMGASGVCFGRVITAVSPKSEPSNWGLVLWHELGHVFAIQLSKNHVPRWFTEGLSEYETLVQRPEWHRSMDPDLWLAMKANRIPKLADMNRAFTHAHTQHDIVTAYYASSQIVVFMAETYGFPKLVQMLKLWGDGKKTPDVLKTATGVSSEAIDLAFRAWVQKKLARYEGQFMFDAAAVSETPDAEKASNGDPKDAQKMAVLASAYYLDKKLDEAIATADKALALDGKNQLAHYIAAKLAFGVKHDFSGARTHVMAIVSAGGDGYLVQNMMADIASAQKDLKAMRAALEKAANYDPSQLDPLIDLYKLAEKENRPDDVLALLRKMVKIDPHERVPWKKLMEALAAKGLWDELVQVGEGAIYVDVFSPEVHAWYARALTMKNRANDALDEVDAGLAAKPKPEGEAMLRVEKARALWKQKKTAQAKSELDAALKLDPKQPDGLKLKGEIK